MPELAQYHITGSTARAIAASVERAIREGLLSAGDALPTVRGLAAQRGSSPATINAAYRILRERGLVITDGRRGTRVASRPALRTPPAPPRTAVDHALPAHVRDLTIGLPDAGLLPPLQPALRRVDIERKLREGGLEAADPELLELTAHALLRDGLPADALSVVSGAFDGLERILNAHLRPGDRVIVEDPGYVGVLDLLVALALTPVPVPVDEFGLMPEPFEAALERGAEAAVIVPRAQNPFGSAMSAEREATLRNMLERHGDVLLVEDDHAGLVSGADCSTLIDGTRSRWAVIRSVSKFLHPDLRLAVLSGDATTIARVEGRQALGPRWVSHVLQAVVVELLREPEFEAITLRARDAYAARRHALIDALAQYGIIAHGRSGLNVWVPVRAEAPVVRGLEEAGWRVLAGERFRLASGSGVRITTSTLPESEAPAVAEALAAIELAARPRRLY